MSLRHAVLGLLADRRASGYDLMKLFDTSLANVWSATQSQLYGELGKLADAGLLEVAAEGPRGRKEYAITDEGAAELRRWLTESEPAATPRSDSLLRVFFLGALTPLEATLYLQQEAARAERRHTAYQRLDESVSWGQDSVSVYGRLVLEYGKRQSAMHEEWARWAADQITTSQRAERAALADPDLGTGTGPDPGTGSGSGSGVEPGSGPGAAPDAGAAQGIASR